MWFIMVICMIVAAVFGYAWEDEEGMVVFVTIAYLVISNLKLRKNLNDLKNDVRTLARKDKDSRATETKAAPIVEEKEKNIHDYQKDEEQATASEDWGFNQVPKEEIRHPEPVIISTPRYDGPTSDLDDELSLPPDESELSVMDKVVALARNFVTKGNVVVKIALIVLFFGVAFLLKYASDRNMFPVEFRYISATVVTLGFLVLGWRLRESNRVYALLVQGGALGVLYMTVFAAAKIHHLIPMGLTFAILVGLVVFSGIMAVLQNARMTAAFGAAGGFLAPVLTSTGSGSHVMLFSYYALLNTGILGIAWYKTWRELNLIGFAFTFGIGSLWGFSAYKPEFFSNTEPFLVLFFLYFSCLSVLFAAKQPPKLKGYVDGSLVFGLPVIAFTLQGFLVKDMDYGLAVSALSLSVYYLALARGLWNRGIDGMRTLTEAFLALGVVFGSLAVPLSLDGRWTAAAWAMEGAALVWVGIRQKRTLARLFGILLQVGAGMSFYLSMHEPSRSIPVINGLYLGCLAVALAALFSSYYLQKHKDILYIWERPFCNAALVWGLLWWYGAGLHDIARYMPARYELSGVIGFAALSAVFLAILFSHLTWPSLKIPLFMLIYALALLLIVQLTQFLFHRNAHPFRYGGYLAWPFALAVFYGILFYHEKKLKTSWCYAQHRMGLWVVLFLLTLEAAFVMRGLTSKYSVWVFMVWGLVPALFAMAIMTRAKHLAWPFGRNMDDYKTMALIPVLAFLVLWFVSGCMTHPGDPGPLPYIPVINPLELIQVFVFLVMVFWVQMMNREVLWFNTAVGKVRAVVISAVLMFIWMNAVLGRSVHMYGHIPFRWANLWHSMLFQAGISVLWTLLALLTMVWAARKMLRTHWFVGAGLLGCVVLKLFFVDLSRSGTALRIVSFLVTGFLMLVIGYFSPLPPVSKEVSK